jgi:hypothetical protein
VCCDERGLARFDVLRRQRNGLSLPLRLRETFWSWTGRTSADRGPQSDAGKHPPHGRQGVRLNEHLEHDCGLTGFQHACNMGLEGIVSKRLGSCYRSRRSPDWLTFKNPEAAAVRREAERIGGTADDHAHNADDQRPLHRQRPRRRTDEVQLAPRGSRLVQDAPSGLAGHPRRNMSELLPQPTGNPTQCEVTAGGQTIGRIALFSALRDHT